MFIDAIFKIQKYLPLLQRLKTNMKLKDMAAISMFLLMPCLEELILIDSKGPLFERIYNNMCYDEDDGAAVQEFNRNFFLLLPKLKIFGTDGIHQRKTCHQTFKNYRFCDLSAIQPCNLEEIETNFNISD